MGGRINQAASVGNDVDRRAPGCFGFAVGHTSGGWEGKLQWVGEGFGAVGGWWEGWCGVVVLMIGGGGRGLMGVVVVRFLYNCGGQGGGVCAWPLLLGLCRGYNHHLICIFLLLCESVWLDYLQGWGDESARMGV